MDSVKVRRFHTVQIALHWGQAVGWLVLLATGGIIFVGQLIQAFSATDAARASILAVHRWAGVALLVFLAGMFTAAAVTRRIGHIARDILDCLLIKPADVLWLIKIPATLFHPRVKLPPAGRFNAGQKLHVAFLVLAVPAFAATGIAMMLQPAGLVPHIIHAILFVAAAMFLAVHLFLALVNPGTRKALTGIFTGHVPYEYAAAHHPLWVGQPQAAEHRDHPPILSRTAFLAALGVVVLVVAGLIVYFGPHTLAAGASQWLAHGGMNEISPGALSSAHADKSCWKCHQAFEGPSPQGCLDCHRKIKDVLAAKAGYHGKFTGSCAGCHHEHAGASADIHPFDTAAFDHRQARFILRGKHQGAPCENCHLKARPGQATSRMRYIGLNFASCADCHKSPHGQAARPEDCALCHSEAGFKRPNVKFNHRNRAKLDATQSNQLCALCHGGRGPSRSPGVRRRDD